MNERFRTFMVVSWIFISKPRLPCVGAPPKDFSEIRIASSGCFYSPPPLVVTYEYSWYITICKWRWSDSWNVYSLIYSKSRLWPRYDVIICGGRDGMLSPLSITATQANQGHLSAHECRRGRTALSSECVTLVLAFTLSGWLLVGGNWQVTKLGMKNSNKGMEMRSWATAI